MPVVSRLTGRYGYLILAICSLLGTTCASHPRPILPTPDLSAFNQLDAADRLVAAGCYACLQRALGIYEQLTVSTPAVIVAPTRAVDTALLLAVRERELGIGDGTALQRAGQLAARLPVPHDYADLLAIAALQPWKGSGVSKELTDLQTGSYRTVSENWSRWRPMLVNRAGRDQLSAYLLLSLEGHYRYRLRDEKLEPWKPGPGASPLLRFQMATCVSVKAGALETLLKEELRLDEAHLFLGETSLVAGKLVAAEQHLLQAVAAIPELTAGHLALGHVYLAMEDPTTARAAYRRVLERVPEHREALLGEAQSLSYLGRSDEALAVLDQMVRLGTWYMGEAYYWRAWNRHRLRQLEVADTDIGEARRRLPTDPQVDKLTGLIAYGRNDAERAEREFRVALEHLASRDGRDCDVGYYLGAALVAQRKWSEGATRFEAAAPCYAEDQAYFRGKIAEIEKSDLSADRKARLIAAKEQQIKTSRLQQARAWYNGAVGYANLGDKTKARPLAERALEHPGTAESARALIARLDAGPGR
jgi:tetratricopeptide (TPR) repeat protein